jgi:hypothetical protein
MVLFRRRFQQIQLSLVFSLLFNRRGTGYGEIMKEKRAVNRYYKCRKTGGAVIEICRDSACEWFVKREGFFNCTWVACHFGPFTLEEVGSMMGVTRERIRQIEYKALQKLQQKKRKDRLRDFSDQSDRA